MSRGANAAVERRETAVEGGRAERTSITVVPFVDQIFTSFAP